ncbi:MAG: SGNH/GDSL hydrolase family protein [Oscillospiraceae bacterium]|nr:SGNH/GDSL hydrolase family protein [Oscillospiraceae bacterium]
MRKYLFAAIVSLLLLTGCDNEIFSGYHVKPDGENPNQQTQTEPEAVLTTEQPAAADNADIQPVSYDPSWKPADPALHLPTLDLGMTTEDMVKRAVLQKGNRARLAAVMKKAQNKEHVTIGCIGGSITQGSGASGSDETYFYRSSMWWAKAFPENASNFEYINAGIGATGSYIGVHRLEHDLLAKKPDLVIVEFSVNDTDPVRDLESYDALVRNILSQPNDPAVILLFMTQEDGTSLADTHRTVGEAYGLPMISYRDAVLPEIRSGAFTWQDISPDNIHPNSKGHGIAAELLWQYYDSVLADLGNISTGNTAFTAEPVGKEKYQNAMLLTADGLTPMDANGFDNADVSQQFPGNWKTDTAGEIVFEVHAANIGILFQRTTDGKSGQYEVLVDGEKTAVLNGNFPNGWGNYAEAQEVYAGTDGPHTVTLKRSADSSADGFGLIGLLLSGGKLTG